MARAAAGMYATAAAMDASDFDKLFRDTVLSASSTEQEDYRSKKLIAVFNFLDKDGNGEVDIEEIKKWGEDLRGKPYTPEEADRILKSFDADDNKSITLQEWLNHHETVIPGNYTVEQFDESLQNYLPAKTLSNLSNAQPPPLRVAQGPAAMEQVIVQEHASQLFNSDEVLDFEARLQEVEEELNDQATWGTLADDVFEARFRVISNDLEFRAEVNRREAVGQAKRRLWMQMGAPTKAASAGYQWTFAGDPLTNFDKIGDLQDLQDGAVITVCAEGEKAMTDVQDVVQNTLDLVTFFNAQELQRIRFCGIIFWTSLAIGILGFCAWIALGAQGSFAHWKTLVISLAFLCITGFAFKCRNFSGTIKHYLEYGPTGEWTKDKSLAQRSNLSFWTIWFARTLLLAWIAYGGVLIYAAATYDKQVDSLCGSEDASQCTARNNKVALGACIT